MRINKLNIKQVENAKATLGDGGGLYLKVDKLGHRKWVFRYTLNGKVNEMGLGGGLVLASGCTQTSGGRSGECRARHQSRRGET